MVEEKRKRRVRIRSTTVSTVISISLVLFMLGLEGIMVLYAKKLSNYVKENITISVFLKDDITEGDIKRLQKSIEAADYVKMSRLISKEDAAALLQEDLGEDFVSFLGYNPLLSSIDINLHADWAHPDSLLTIEEALLLKKEVKEVYYQRDLVQLMNENIRTISIVILGFSTLLVFIAIALINSSIRLSIYSQRFLIRSMQLVGATHWFIRKPFIINGILRGILASLIAIGLLGGLLYGIKKEVPFIWQKEDLHLVSLAFLCILGLGIFFSWISTSLAVRKYLRIRPDKLY